MATLQHSPADIISRLLIAVASDMLTDPSLVPLQAWPCYVSREPDVPDDVVTIYDTMGRDDGQVMNDGELQEHPGIQIRIRATRPDIGYDKARTIATTLDKGIYANRITVDGVSYLVH